MLPGDTHSMEVTGRRLLMNFWYRSSMKCIMSTPGTLSAKCLVSAKNHAVLVRMGRACLVAAFLHSVLKCNWILSGPVRNGVTQATIPVDILKHTNLYLFFQNTILSKRCQRMITHLCSVCSEKTGCAPYFETYVFINAYKIYKIYLRLSVQSFIWEFCA